MVTGPWLSLRWAVLGILALAGAFVLGAAVGFAWLAWWWFG